VPSELAAFTIPPLPDVRAGNWGAGMRLGGGGAIIEGAGRAAIGVEMTFPIVLLPLTRDETAPNASYAWLTPGIA